MSRKMSYIHTPRIKPLLYTTIGELVEKWGEEQPDKLALVVRKQDGRSTLTFGDLNRWSLQFARFVASRGVKPGDMMGMFMGNSPYWMIANVGVTRAGGAGLNSFGYTQDENFDWLLKTGCTGLVVDLRDDSVFDDLVRKLTKLTNDAEREQRDFLIIYIPNEHRQCDSTKWVTFEEALNDSHAHILPVVNPESSCYIFQSSGSTGKPKNIVHKHFGLINNGDTLADMMELSNDDIFWGPRPMGYGAGFPIVTFVRGVTFITIDGSIHQKGTELSERTITIMIEEGITSGYLSPYFVFDLDGVREKIGQLPQLKTVVTGGQRISAESMARLAGFSRRASQGYGCGETKWTTYHVVTDPADAVDDVMGTPIPGVEVKVVDDEGETVETGVNGELLCYGCVEIMWSTYHVVTDPEDAEDDIMGTPIPGVEVKVVDDDGETVETGVNGELLVRSPYMLSHYILHDGKRSYPKTDGGWFPTGDIACFHPDGRTYIRGRKIEVIKKYAAKIYPATIEHELLKHPDVQEICVVGVPEPRMYEEIVAIVARKAGATLTLDELSTFAMADFRPDIGGRQEVYMPGHFFIVNSIPKLVSGKINRREVKRLAEQMVAGSGR